MAPSAISLSPHPRPDTGDSTPLDVTFSAPSRVPYDLHGTPQCSKVGLGSTPERDLPPPQPPPLRAQRITFTTAPPRPTPSCMDKARPLPIVDDAYFLPPGSLTDPSILIRTASPTTQFKFPFHTAEETYCDYNILAGTPQQCLMDSVTHVVGLPRVCGLSMLDDLEVRVSRNVHGPNAWDNLSLVDGGANICLTGILDLLVDVVSIAPLPISVATKTGEVSLDDCWTKRGLLPLTLADGSVYYQPCY
jgi:hypothetical protein